MTHAISVSLCAIERDDSPVVRKRAMDLETERIRLVEDVDDPVHSGLIERLFAVIPNLIKGTED